MTAIWAHRGASAYAPENTIPAFKLAIEQGADGIEFDVQRTADGHLVVIHDENINRTSNGFGKVVDLTLEELRRCDFSHGFVGFRKVRIPTLQETLELLAPTDLVINVELKNSIEPYPGLEDEALEIVREAGVLDRTIFSSFNHYSLANLRGRVGSHQIGLLFAESLFDPWRYAKMFGAGAIHPNRLAINHPHFMWLCHEAGVKAHVWTVDDEHEVEHMKALGVDAIITNFPDRPRKGHHY